jgi:hypothetical protein
VAELIAGTAANATALERELMVLVRKAHERPRLLVRSDLDPIRALVGAGALDYALVVGSFHFVNRIADLLGVSPEVLPEPLRRFERLRRFGVRLAGAVVKRTMAFENRPYQTTYEQALADITPVFESLLGRPPGDALASVRERPKLIEAIRLMLEERQTRSSLDSKLLAQIHRVVEDALAERPEDVEGLHPRPDDPVDAFAFVGTRYASRTTPKMIEALRKAGYDDLGILDLATAVADANNWARLYRLTGLAPEIGYVRA